VGLIDNRIVCMGAFRKKSDTLAEIKRMRVHPDYQRRGFGEIILNKLEEKASRMDIQNILDTTTNNWRLKECMRKTLYRRWAGKFRELDLIFYRKQLSPQILKVSAHELRINGDPTD